MLLQKLFNISCTHQYFAGGLCSALAIEPTPYSNRLLKRFRLIVNSQGAGVISIVSRQPEGSAAMPSLSSALLFYIFITDNEFYNYTSLPPVSTLANSKTIAEETAPAQAQITTLLFENAGSSSDTITVTGKITLPDSAAFHQRRLLGIIRIAALPPAFKNYVLPLEAVAAKWRYYIITDATLKNVKVKDADSSPSGSPQIMFTQITGNSVSDTVYRNLTLSFPDANIFISESDSEIAMMQKPTKLVKLVQVTDENSESALIDSLPIPAPKEAGKKIIFVQNKSPYL